MNDELFIKALQDKIRILDKDDGIMPQTTILALTAVINAVRESQYTGDPLPKEPHNILPSFPVNRFKKKE